MKLDNTQNSSPGFLQQLGKCKQNGVRQNMDCAYCWLWGFVARILEWNERNNFKDDSFVDVYQLWVSDVNNASVWFAYKYCAPQTFQIS